jgi:hypothetical protein
MYRNYVLEEAKRRESLKEDKENYLITIPVLIFSSVILAYAFVGYLT